MFFIPSVLLKEKKRLWEEYNQKITNMPYYDEVRWSRVTQNANHLIARDMRNNITQARLIDQLTMSTMIINITFHLIDKRCEEYRQQLSLTAQNSTPDQLICFFC